MIVITCMLLLSSVYCTQNKYKHYLQPKKFKSVVKVGRIIKQKVLFFDFFQFE